MNATLFSKTPPATRGPNSKPSAQRTDTDAGCQHKAAVGDFNPVFIHSRLDDYGLPAPVFRVYCHIARRVGRDGRAWPSIANIARVCCLHPQTVRKALRALAAHHLLQSETRPGRTTDYRLTPASAWRPAIT